MVEQAIEAGLKAVVRRASVGRELPVVWGRNLGEIAARVCWAIQRVEIRVRMIAVIVGFCFVVVVPIQPVSQDMLDMQRGVLACACSAEVAARRHIRRWFRVSHWLKGDKRS